MEEKLLKQYVGKDTLEMILGGQRSLLGRAKINEYEKLYVQQTKSLLTTFLSEETQIASADLVLLEDLAYALRNTSHGNERKEAEILLKKVLHKTHERREKLQKLKDINFVAFNLNNKKLAKSLSPEELLMAYKTVEKDSASSLKFKTRLKQQLQSFALLKYAEIKPSSLAVNANKEFIDTFKLRHKNIVSPISFKTVQNIPAEQPKKENKFFSFFKKAKEKVLDAIDNIRHNVKVFYYRHEAKFAIGSFALLGLFGYKINQSIENENAFQEQCYHSNSYYNPYNNPYDTATNDSAKTADFVKEAQNINIQKAENITKDRHDIKQKTIISGDYFDTALEIHLKSKEKVQSLYDKIDSLAEDGKIKFENGTNTKKYAHAFTMYNLIRPNSVENKKIQNLLNGGKENPELINHLVLKAKDNGTGVKPDNQSIKTSNFDNASKALQQQHLKNLKSLSL